MEDITIIFLTNDRLPSKWKQFHKEKLLEAVGNAPIITLSREPSDLGINLIKTNHHLRRISSTR
jgi:hypothetical protein